MALATVTSDFFRNVLPRRFNGPVSARRVSCGARPTLRDGFFRPLGLQFVRPFARFPPPGAFVISECPSPTPRLDAHQDFRKRPTPRRDTRLAQVGQFEPRGHDLKHVGASFPLCDPVAARSTRKRPNIRRNVDASTEICDNSPGLSAGEIIGSLIVFRARRPGAPQLSAVARRAFLAFRLQIIRGKRNVVWRDRFNRARGPP